MLKKQLQEELLHIGLGDRDTVTVPPAVAQWASVAGSFVALSGAASGPGGCQGTCFSSLLPGCGGTHESAFRAVPRELKLVTVHVGVRITVAQISWCACHAARGVMDGLGCALGRAAV